MRSRRTRTLSGLTAALGASLVLLTTSAVGQDAHAARACTVPKYPGSGYFTSLTVTRTTCPTGRKVALAYYRCRIKHGPAGRCHRDVLGFSCHEIRQSIPTEIDARVT